MERHLQVHSGVRLRPPARRRPSHPAGLHPGDAQPALPAGHRNSGSRILRLHPAEEGGSSRTPPAAAQGSPLCCPHSGPHPWSARSRPRQQRARCRPPVHSCGPFGVLRRVGRRGGHRGAQRAPCEGGRRSRAQAPAGGEGADGVARKLHVGQAGQEAPGRRGEEEEEEEEVTPGEEDGGGEGPQEGGQESGQEVMLVPNQARGVLKSCFRKSAP